MSVRVCVCVCVCATAAGYKRIHVGKDCKSGAELDLGGGKASVAACGTACTAAKGAGCKYFIFGTGSKAGNCWWEESCSSTSTNSYDVYQTTHANGTSHVLLVLAATRTRTAKGSLFDLCALEKCGHCATRACCRHAALVPALRRFAYGKVAAHAATLCVEAEPIPGRTSVPCLEI